MYVVGYRRFISPLALSRMTVQCSYTLPIAPSWHRKTAFLFMAGFLLPISTNPVLHLGFFLWFYSCCEALDAPVHCHSHLSALSA
ncbi:hypothetical protein CYLTODRAFT_420492 [Cylindrobasidium torrendii FP15055 ss-10]|uniref:Uncharacterized protein n=1 Tax=Cylindrobasidium torrendii FP15055 ss-10 TaxID=1314674 RepID=A0A0D7BGS0_9AGAR|nr:hypothetical protein CYLTODRAFT_420492 [Cylindrobasidium torrendii FP15055 ss-10]